MKKILLLLVFLSTILFSKIETIEGDSQYTSIFSWTGGASYCQNRYDTESTYDGTYYFTSQSSCSNAGLPVPANFTFLSCSYAFIFSEISLTTAPNGDETSCTLELEYHKVSKLEYICTKFDIPYDQRPFASDGVTRMEINPDTCEWVEPCIPPTDRVIASFDGPAASQECQNSITNLSSIYSDLGNSLYCHSCDPDNGPVTMYQRTITCSDGFSPVTKEDSGGALMCESDIPICRSYEFLNEADNKCYKKDSYGSNQPCHTSDTDDFYPTSYTPTSQIETIPSLQCTPGDVVWSCNYRLDEYTRSTWEQLPDGSCLLHKQYYQANRDKTDQTDTSCTTNDLSTVSFFGTQYQTSDYFFHSYSDDILNCSNNVLGSNSIDGVYTVKYTNPNCNRYDCYAHRLNTGCDNFYPNDYKPAGNWDYKSYLTSTQCANEVDLIKFVQYQYKIPDPVQCPDVGICFLQLKDSNSTNQEDTDDSMKEQDVNSTSNDLKPVVRGINTTNKHLEDLKDKVDLTNQSLEDIKDVTNDVLTASQKTNKILESFDLKNSQERIVSEAKLSNIKLSDTNKYLNGINSNIYTANSKLTSANIKLTGINDKLASIDASLKKDKNISITGLVGDDPFVDFNYSDGSASFGSLQNQVSDNFGITTHYNIFGLANVSGEGLQTYSAYVMGRTITVFEPSMLQAFPIVEIRSLFMFMFALLGFIHVFRSI